MAKVKIPKRVAGVKVPKKVRRNARRALKATESPVVREFAAAALGAAASAGVARARARTDGDGRALAARAVIRVDADKIADAVRSAALDGLRRFLEGFEEGLRNMSARAAEAEGADEPSPRRRRPNDSSADAAPE